MSDETLEYQQPKSVGLIGLGSKCICIYLSVATIILSHIHAFHIDMGWWMAFNLRKSSPQSTQLFIYDIRSEVLEDFAKQSHIHGLGPVSICSSSREVAEKSVSPGSHVAAKLCNLNYPVRTSSFPLFPKANTPKTFF